MTAPPSPEAQRIAEAALTATGGGPDSPLELSWRPVDLTDVLSGAIVRFEPSLGLRSDGQALLYAGKVHSIAGESEGGKSWVALLFCAQQLQAGCDVLYLDLEDDKYSVVGRLRDLGVDIALILKHFAYVNPEGPLADAAARLLSRNGPYSLVIIDGVTELMSMFGLDPKSDVDVVEMMRLPRALAASGPPVVLLDHVVKERMSRGRYATGSQHKLSSINGATYSLVIKEPFGIGKAGSSTLLLNKDRPGAIRGLAVRTAGGHAVATLNVAYDGKDTTFSLDAGAPKWVPTDLMKRISKELESLPQGDALTYNTVKELVGGRSQSVRAALDALIQEGYVSVADGSNRSIKHTSIRPYPEPG